MLKMTPSNIHLEINNERQDYKIVMVGSTCGRVRVNERN
jgi:hypothetical protein